MPYWPAQNCYNYKEVWVHPSSRWLWLMDDHYSKDTTNGVEYFTTKITEHGSKILLQINPVSTETQSVRVHMYNLTHHGTSNATNIIALEGLYELEVEIVNMKEA